MVLLLKYIFWPIFLLVLYLRKNTLLKCFNVCLYIMHAFLSISILTIRATVNKEYVKYLNY